MKFQNIIFLFIIIIGFEFIHPQSIQQFGEIGNLNLINGEIIENCKIGYRTFGKLSEDRSNIIIYPTWFGGTSEAIGSLIQKLNFVDTTKYYIIALDALANGVSTSPSNYQGKFPEITIRDMVNAEYLLLTGVLNINHIYGAIGGSMGSMQVLEWSVAYPDFMNKIVAYVASPKMTSYDLLWMNTQLNMIETSRKNGMSDREVKKISDMMTAMISRTPAYVVENTSVNNFSEYLSSFDKEPSKLFTIDNYVAQLKAMMKHDISRNFNGSFEGVAKAIKARLFIIVSETDMMVNPTETLKLAEITDSQKLILENNCGHLAVGCEIDKCREAIAEFFNE